MDTNAFNDPDLQKFMDEQMKRWFAMKAQQATAVSNDTPNVSKTKHRKNPTSSGSDRHRSHGNRAGPQDSRQPKDTDRAHEHASQLQKKRVSYEDPIVHTPHSNNQLPGRRNVNRTPRDYSDDDLQEIPMPIRKKHSRSNQDGVTSSDEFNSSSQSHLPSQQVMNDNQVPKKSSGCLYKDRKGFMERMQLKPMDGPLSEQVRDIRADMKMLCARRGIRLNRLFESFGDTKMFQLIRNITPDMAKLNGEQWDQELVRDLIHAMCIDKIRNRNALRRRKMNKKNGGTTLDSGSEQVKLPLSVKRTHVNEGATQPQATGHDDDGDGNDHDDDDDDEEGDNEEGQDGEEDAEGSEDDSDLYNDPRQSRDGQRMATVTTGVAPPSNTERPLIPYNPTTPMHPRTGSAAQNQIVDAAPAAVCTQTGVVTDPVPDSAAMYDLYTTTTESTPSCLVSPLAGKGVAAKGGSQITENCRTMGVEGPEEFQEFPDSIPDTQPVLPNCPPPYSQGREVPTYIPIHMKGLSPRYIAANVTYDEFERRIAQRVEIPDDRFLQYRPVEAGPGGKWMTVGIQSAWVKLVQTCGESGAFVRVVGDSWFDENAPDSDEGVGNTSTINPTILFVNPALKLRKGKGKRIQANASQVQESQFQGSQRQASYIPESQNPESQPWESQMPEPFQVPGSQMTGSNGTQLPRRRKNTATAAGKAPVPQSIRTQPLPIPIPLPRARPGGPLKEVLKLPKLWTTRPSRKQLTYLLHPYWN